MSATHSEHAVSQLNSSSENHLPITNMEKGPSLCLDQSWGTGSLKKQKAVTLNDFQKYIGDTFV